MRPPSRRPGPVWTASRGCVVTPCIRATADGGSSEATVAETESLAPLPAAAVSGDRLRTPERPLGRRWCPIAVTATGCPQELAAAAVVVSHPVGGEFLDIATTSGMVITRHRMAGDGLGVRVRDSGHVIAPDTAATATPSTGRPHRRKERIPPGPVAKAAAAQLLRRQRRRHCRHRVINSVNRFHRHRPVRIPHPGACPVGVGVLLRFVPFNYPPGSWKGPKLARRSWNVTAFVEMFRYWYAGRSQVQIHHALGIDRKTIRRYLAPAAAEGLEPAPEVAFDEQLWRARIGRWFPELVDPSVRAVRWGQIAVHHAWIAEQLAVPVTVATIAQRLRDDRGVDVSASTVRRYIATAFAEQYFEDRVSVPRGAVDPGSEAQIDYGKLGMWLDPTTGRRVAAWVFAKILSCSRALFIQPVLKIDQTSWNASHVAAVEFFGGVHGPAGV